MQGLKTREGEASKNQPIIPSSRKTPALHFCKSRLWHPVTGIEFTILVGMNAYLLLGSDFLNLQLLKYMYFETVSNRFGEEEEQIKINP